MSDATNRDAWTKPSAMALPKEGTSPSSRVATARPTRERRRATGSRSSRRSFLAAESVIRDYGKSIEAAVAGTPDCLAVLKLHYLRWVLFDIGKDTYFMYQGIFDTDFDKYTEDAVNLFTLLGINTVFENLEGFPADWKTNAPRRSSSSSASTSARASWSTASTRS